MFGGAYQKNVTAAAAERRVTDIETGARNLQRQREALAAELLADPKERAEHLMLLDLGRNDVGRVSEIGTLTTP
jgi:hypothetical protein